jgi:hypothetical protein
VLEARGCSFNDPAMTMIGRSLRLGSVVKILHLENCFLSGRPLMLLGMCKLAAALDWRCRLSCNQWMYYFFKI